MQSNKATDGGKFKLPPMLDELYEHYPAMSAQAHQDLVKDYARTAVAKALLDHANVLAVMTSDAVHDVIAERKRQVEVEGFDASHDDMATNGQLADAAMCYAHPKYKRIHWSAPIWWPWDLKWWKPTTPRRDFVKAASLLIAEIERLDRATARELEAGQ